MSENNVSECQDGKVAEANESTETKDLTDVKAPTETLEAGKETPEIASTENPPTEVDTVVAEPQAEASEHYKYDEHGVMIYTDPVSKVEYVLDSSGTTWVPKAESESKYKFDGKTYLYTDELTGVKHRWDLEKNDWVKIEGEEDQMETETASKEQSDEVEEESEEEEGTTDAQRKERQFRKRKAMAGWGRKGTYTTDPETGSQLYKDTNDGMVYEWDKAKNAWFPRIDEDFMAVYQMNYGFTPEGVAEPTKPSETSEAEKAEARAKAETEEKKARKAEQEKGGKKKPHWFEEDLSKTTKVYVTNLPEDIDEEKFLELMSKCGVVDVDVRSNKPKIKIYRDENGAAKGDALCTYVKVESVDLALTIIDGSTLHSQSGKATVVSVDRAKFEMKGQAYDATKKPKKLGKKEIEKIKRRKDKLLAWIPDQMRGQRKKSDKVIVIQNVFDFKDFDRDASLILECSAKLREHCSKFGTVTKVCVYDKNPEGICQVFFKTPEEADLAISMLDGRLFSKACGAMKCYTWDGKTKYKISESAEEEKARLENWEKFLKAEDDEGEKTDTTPVKESS